MTTVPSDFIQTTDFATTKQDNSAIATVVLPGSTSVPGSGSVEFHTDVVIGAKAAITRMQIASSKYLSNDRNVCSQLIRTYSGPYQAAAYATRINATTLRCSVFIPNPSAVGMTTVAGDETFTFYIDTFLPPFV